MKTLTLVALFLLLALGVGFAQNNTAKAQKCPPKKSCTTPTPTVTPVPSPSPCICAPSVVSGQVVDNVGAPIANAKITSVDLASGYSWDVYTDSFGFFTIPGLHTGNAYAFYAEAPGYIFDHEPRQPTDSPQVFTVLQDTSILFKAN